MAANFDREEILRTWHIFRQPGEVLELRIPEAGRYKTISGYFNDPGKLADAVIGLADGPFPGIYFSVNPVKPELLARAANRYVKYAKTTTSDADITALHWLLVDLDAKRPAGISATVSEHAAAIEKAREIRQWLIEEQGWPAAAFVLADSGNGGHLNIKIDLPTTDRDLVEGCLATLDFLFSNETVEVDTTSGNPARIWKLYGTMVKKGDNTPERPHRLARILEAPERPEAVTRNKLEALAAMLPGQEEQPTTYGGQEFDPVAYCQAHNLQVHHTKPYNGGILAVLEQCIFNPDHHLSACVIGWPNGARTYRCRHHSCLAKRWREAREVIEPAQKTQAEHKKPTTEGADETEESSVSEEELKDLPKSFNPRLDLHLEPSNFISKYIEYAKTTSDAYEEYHFASGLVLLSVAADRQIVISLRHGDIYPNIWIFPIGDSTVSRKTTAHRLCKLILKTKYPKKSLPSSFSPEALMDAISSTPRCFYLKDEAGSLLASLCKDYMAETRDFLAEIYECDDYYRKLKKSECIITDPYITQYLMTTPDNLKEYTTPLDLTSGWLLRYLWMYPNHPKEWRAFAEKDGSDFEKYTTIYGEYSLVVEKLATPRRLSMTAESMQFFQEWQRGIEEAAMKNADNITKALAGRLMTHAVKMAALFTVGREDFDDNSKIELPHIREAARMVVEYFLPIGRIIIEEVARAESKNVQDKIIGTIKRWNGLISQRDLLRALHLPLKDVDLAIGALVMAEEIERVSIQSKKGSKLCYALIKSETKECHSDIVSHNEVYKGKSKEKNNKEPNNDLYTPYLDTTPHRQRGQDRIKDGGEEKTGIGPHTRRDLPTPQKQQREAGDDDWLGDEIDIIWPADPHKYTYLREAIASSSRPDGPIDLNLDDNKTLIGYAIVSPNDEEYYERRFWYLTKQDQDPAGIYSSGPAPSGAVDPKSISAGAPSIPWECPTVEPTPEPEEIRFLARFRTEYKTEWPRGGGRYEPITYQEGEECVAPLERALKWKGRGVVDLVEIVLPWEPPEEATA